MRIEVKDSNAFKPGSYWVYEVTPTPGGGSHVHMEFDRRPRNLKGIVVSTALDLFGEKIYREAARRDSAAARGLRARQPRPVLRESRRDERDRARACHVVASTRARAG